VSFLLLIVNLPHDVDPDSIRLYLAISVVDKLEQQLREMYEDSSEDSERASLFHQFFVYYDSLADFRG